jgi:Protein of unknown function (DUF2510)
MKTTPPGWYPDPTGGPGQRYYDGSRWTEHSNTDPVQPRSGIPNWVWAAVAVGLSLIVAIVVAVVVFTSGPPMPSDSDASSTASSAAPARSALMPELQLPQGATKRDYASQEVFDVSQPFAETVDELRPQLPIGRAYDGLAWCAETDTGDESTTWSWGDESDYLTVWVSSSPQNPGSTVQIAREPRAAGCRR